MKYFLLFALVALVAARPDGDEKPRPKPRGPLVLVKKIQGAKKDDTLEFRFGVAGMKPLDESEVHLWKVVKGEKGPELKETDFDISLKTLTEEDIKEWIEKKKEEWKGDDEGDDDDEERCPRPHPRLHFKSAIAGKVTVAGVSCEDQGPYLVHYGKMPDEKPRRKPRGAFLLLVKGCRRPEPEDE